MRWCLKVLLGRKMYFLLIQLKDGGLLLRNVECAILAHVLQRRQVLFGGHLWQSRYTMLKNPTVILLDGKLFAWAIGRFKVFPNTETAIGIDAPRKFNPELVLFPYFAGIGLIGILYPF